MKQAIAIAIRRLSALKFFPADAISQAEIMRTLERMVSNSHELEWLIETLLDSADEWPGLRSLRGLFCTRFRPRDGKEALCGLPGFRAEDCEARASLEPATRLLAGTAEAPMDPAELARFHNELLTPLLGPRKPPRIDRDDLRRVEDEIVAAKPTLTEEEKRRRIQGILDSFETAKTANQKGANQDGLLSRKH